MFNRARLKLTGWYLAIIMVISLSFSFVIYRAYIFEIERFANNARLRYVRTHDPRQSAIEQEMVDETKQRLINNLILINAGILFGAGILGYYLSGKTLSPIKTMMDEQYRFVSDASHELKTPITSIRTTLEVALRDKRLSISEARENIKNSLEEVSNLQRLTENLLELSTSNIIAKSVPIDIAKVTKDALGTIAALAKLRHIRVKQSLTSAVVQIDETRLKATLVAILDNAIKYSEDNSYIEVKTSIVKNKVRVEIVDHGIGISKTDLPKIFDRFYRSDPSRHTKGYGLGLSIAKKMIESYEGMIEIDSTINKGTRVTLLLPSSGKLQNIEG